MKVYDLIPNRYEKKYEEVDKKIIGIAMNLFMKQGFNATKMEQIADEVDIARQTLYNHFPVKESIINAYVQRAIKRLEPDMRECLQGLPDTRSRLISCLLKQWEWFKNTLPKDILEQYYFYRIQLLFKSNKDQNQRDVFGGILTDIIKLGQETGEVRQDVSGEELVNQLGWIHTKQLIAWLDNPDKYPITERINMVVDLFLNGAKSRDT